MSTHVPGYEHPDSVNAHNTGGGGYKCFTEGSVDSGDSRDNVYISHGDGANYRTFTEGGSGDAYTMAEAPPPIAPQSATVYDRLQNRVRSRPLNQGSGVPKPQPPRQPLRQTPPAPPVTQRTMIDALPQQPPMHNPPPLTRQQSSVRPPPQPARQHPLNGMRQSAGVNPNPIYTPSPGAIQRPVQRQPMNQPRPGNDWVGEQDEDRKTGMRPDLIQDGHYSIRGPPTNACPQCGANVSYCRCMKQ
jgi:hypothetical protein